MAATALHKPQAQEEIRAPAIFRPLTLAGLTLRNRLVLSPMCTYCASGGMADDFHLAHLARFAMGGFGLVFVEATAVTEDGRITHGDLGLWKDEQIEGLSRIAAQVQSFGAKAGIQLAHAGRKSSMQRPWHGNGPLDATDEARGEQPWAIAGPGEEPMEAGWLKPHALSSADVKALVGRWRDAARRAHSAGFDALEIHAAHGYLLHQFLSPLCNRRSDAYGGSREGRMRFPLEVVEAVRGVWPADKPLFFRISATDAAPEGWNVEDSVALAASLRRLGVDVVDCSSGGLSAPQASTGLPRGLGFQVPLAAEIRNRAPIATMAVGLIVLPDQANAVVASNAADLVAIGRAALHNPNWPLHAREALDAAAGFGDWPLQFGWWLTRRKPVLDVAMAAPRR
ncbi:MAG TPA: NADH:flavin oxidoreductase/NADH oxidase [Ramlibacter sp.]|nr:NADH:flavin oxidoreductase/NADH oxidase [Ramlibacter sp.]